MAKLRKTQRLILKSLSISETLEGKPQPSYPNVKLGNFNLFIGDNAQGKSRLLRTLKFISNLFGDERKPIGSEFKGELFFQLIDNAGKKQSDIKYKIEIKPGIKGNIYAETITRDKVVLLSTIKKKVINEKTGEVIPNIFLAENFPALSAISGKEYPTISMIRDFLRRMLFVDADKGRQIKFQPIAKIVDSQGSNLVSVLNHYYSKNRPIFNEITNEFKKCFDAIKSISFKAGIFKEISSPQERRFKLLALSERGVKEKILQLDWSDGMYRILHLITLPKIIFEIENTNYPPSCIFVDEIENGLDYKRLQFITDYLKDHSNDMQIVLTSHSPMIRDFIPLEYWGVFKRKGSKVNVHLPREVEKDLNKQLDLYKYKNDEFYRRHIANSNLYKVK